MRTKLFFAALLFCGATFAQNTTAPVILKAPSDYYVACVSPNGKWACGDYRDGSEDGSWGFRWNLETGEIEMLNPEDVSWADAVTDDGTVIGRFTDRTYNANGSSMWLAGYWKNSKWHRLQMPGGNVEEAEAYYVTRDGQYICGTVSVGPIDYVGYVWKDGKIYKKLSTEKSRINHPAAVTPDGEVAVGFLDDKGRRGCIWEADGTISFLTDNGSGAQAKKISPDGTKMLYEGEHVLSSGNYGRYAIRDLATRKDEIVYPKGTKPGDLTFLAISDKGTVMGIEGSRGFVYQNGTPYYADEYLIAHGVDLASEHVFMMPETDYWQVFQGKGVSADDNVMAFQYYNDNINANGDYSVAVQSMVVKFNQPATGLSPVGVHAVQARGTSSVLVSWMDNVATKSVTGYNVYRGSKKLNTELITDKAYVDADLADGDYSYTVTAVYGDTESSQSEEVTATVTTAISSPSSVYSMQYGYSSANIGWNTPEANLGSLTYNDENAKVETFGLNKKNLSYETAVMFEPKDFKPYNGQKISAVGFNPLEAQGGWKINLYTYDENDQLRLLYSQPVTQELNYGKRNIVKLDVPQDIPAGNLVVAAEVAVVKASKSINAMITENAKNGYTDLLRKTTEPNFYSLGDYYKANGVIQLATWTMDVIFAPEGTDLDKVDVDHYNVYADGSYAGTTKDMNYVVQNISAGKHDFGVSAVYADGKESATAATTLDIATNDKILKGIDWAAVLSTSKTAAKVVWNAPADKDNVTLQYCSGNAAKNGVMGPSEYNYNFMAGTKYSHDMFKGRDGYVIRSVRFYPTSDATFTVLIYKDNEVINETEIYDYKKNQWNEVELSEPITVDAGSEYLLAIDCYDVTPQTAPLANDMNKAKSGYSDLYSYDGGTTWSTVLSGSYISYNWMMGLNIESPKGVAFPVEGYDVKIDGVKKADKIKATEFEYDFGAEDSNEHTVQVDVYYTVKSESVSGNVFRFYLGVDGIEENVVGKLGITKGNNELTVTGSDVKSVELVSASGADVASAKGNTVSLNGLASGIYVVKAVVGGKTVTRKIVIEK